MRVVSELSHGRRESSVQYATVNGRKQKPSRHAKGICPCCDGEVIAKCGNINAWHWAHRVGGECDLWSEPIGPWHLSWQDLMQPEVVEVPMDGHRADIVGNGDVVIELQHSNIQSGVIQAREQFYRHMIWVFDATDRFAMVECGDRGFFSLGRIKHIQCCRQPVVLDFGHALIQVERFLPRKTLDRVSGYGVIRSRTWFASEYLSNHLRPDIDLSPPKYRGKIRTSPWSSDVPYGQMRFATRWSLAGDMLETTIKCGAIKIPLNYEWKTGRDRRPVWEDVIQKCPEIANGWIKDDLLRMKGFLSGTPVILGGLLRLLPAKAEEIDPKLPEIELEQFINGELASHIAAGRVPVLRPETISMIRSKAQPSRLETKPKPASNLFTEIGPRDDEKG